MVAWSCGRLRRPLVACARGAGRHPLAACCIFALLTLCLGLAGCGGASAPAGTGRVVVNVAWPARAAHGRLIPAASNAIQVQIDSAQAVVAGPVTLKRPSDFGASASASFSAVPAGAYTLRANAFPSVDQGGNPNGTAQASAAVAIIVADGQTTNASMTMNSTVASVIVALPADVPRGGSASATATAKDATGNVVLVAPSTLAWSSLNTGIATVTANADGTASVKGIGTGSTVISAAYTEPSPHVAGTAKVTVTAGGGSGLQSGSPWPMGFHDVQHSGRGAGSGAAGVKAWEVSMGIASSPAIAADGTVYTCSGGTFYAINPAGSRKWTYFARQDAIGAPAIGSDGTIYIACETDLFAMNPDGTRKWEFHTGFGGGYSSPAIGADGTIYVCGGRSLFAVNPNGALRWQFMAGALGGAGVTSSPAIGPDGTIYVIGSDIHLYAVNPDGSQRWAFTKGAADTFCSSPAIAADGTIYVHSGSFVYAIDPNGTQKWSFLASIYGAGTSSPAIGADGTIYVGSGDGNLYALRPDGTKKWAFDTQKFITSSPVIDAAGTIYIGSQNGKLFAVNPSGSQKWAFTTAGVLGNSSPAIGADGVIYVSAGTLYAIR